MSSRIDVIGQNGNDGEHYKEVHVHLKKPTYRERLSKNATEFGQIVSEMLEELEKANRE